MVTKRSDVSVTYRFESSSAAPNSSASRDSSVGVDRRLEADRVSGMTRATTESKAIKARPNFKKRVASVSSLVEVDRRSVKSSVEAVRPFFFYFDADDGSRRGTKATMTRCETTRLTSTRIDGLVTAGCTVVTRGKCDVIVTDCMMSTSLQC